MAVNFFQLEAFVTVAQCQSYTRAAKLLFTSQSNISRTIQALENELATELFMKKGNRAIPTEAGCLFLDSSQFLLEEYRRVQNQIGRYSGGKRRFAVVFAHSIALLGLLEPLERYMEQHRQVELTIYEATTMDYCAMLDMHQADVAVAIIDEEQLDTASYLCRPLETCAWRLAVPEKSPLAKRSRINLTEARDERFIMPYTHQKEFILYCQRVGFYPSIAHYTSSLHSTLTLVAEGFGVTLLQGGIHTDRHSQHICYIELDEFQQNTLALICRREESSPLIKEFMDLYCEHYERSRQ